MKQENKRAAITAFGFLPVHAAQVSSRPGSSEARLTGKPVSFAPSAADFKEVIQNVGKVEQQFSAMLTDISVKSISELRILVSSPVLVVLTYSNHQTRVVGSEDFPVSVTLEEFGRPARIKLSFKRDSPEPSKFLVL